MANPDDTDKKAERLRRARDLAASRGGAAPAAPPPTSAPTAPPRVAAPPADAAALRAGGLMELIASLFRAKPAAAPVPVSVPGGIEPPAFTISVAALSGDVEGAAAQVLIQGLAARPAFKVKPLARVFQLDSLEDPAQVTALSVNTRHAVAEEDADLLVWGEVGREGFRLRFAIASADDERTAGFGPATRIDLPLDITEPVSNLLFAAALAAIDPTTDLQKATQKRLLPAAAQAAEPLAQRPPVQMAMPQQRAVQLVFGLVCSAAAAAAPADQAEAWLDKAVTAFRQALRRLGRTDPGWETGLIHKHTAAAIVAKADRAAEPAPLLEEAIQEWRLAAETLPRALMPQDWAMTQVRLGTALYRLDLLTGQTELLRESLQALQASLQVYSRTETPARWAEVMNTIAQVLEVYGDQLKNPEVLSRAVDACHAVLEIRTRERMPLSWAATQNTLGSALFLLDRHAGGGSHLAEAEEALSAALDVFQSYGAKGPAKVAARNLAHVRKLAETRKTRTGIDPHWLDS